MDIVIEYIQASLFNELAVLMLIAGVMGFVGQKLRQPLIAVFIGVGLITGPDMLNLTMQSESSHSSIETLAELGVVLLLFMVGLKLNPSVIRTMGLMALIVGMAQVALTTILGMGLCMALGFNTSAAFICGLGLAFSSTIIVVKLLSDQREIESLYGKMALGILIIQDLVVIITVVVMGGMTEGAAQGLPWASLGITAVKLLVMSVVVALFTRFFADHVAHSLSRSSELTVIFAIGYAAALAVICESFGLSKELGGLLAGVSLAPTSFRTAIYARLSSLRDFLLLFFFINLGTHISFSGLVDQWISVVVISVFVLLAKPIIIMAVMGALGYRKRSYYQTGIVLAQISEFSLILSAFALEKGFLDNMQFNVMTLTAMVTIAFSTYLSLNSGRLYKYMEHILSIFERSSMKEGDFLEKINKDYDVIIFGMGRYGTAMTRRLQESGIRVLGIDFDPDTVKSCQKIGIPTIYGDASDPEFPAFLQLDHVHTIVLCMPHAAPGPMVVDTRRSLVKSLRIMGFIGRIVVTSHRRDRDGDEYEDDLPGLGVDIVLRPYRDAAISGAEQILTLENKL